MVTLARAARRALVAAVVLALVHPGWGRGAQAVSVPPGGSPLVGRKETVLRVSGRVTLRLPRTSTFVPLTGARTVPDGAEVDATSGRVAVTVSTGTGSATSTADAYRGRFVIHQVSGQPATTHFALSTPLACTATSQRSLDLVSPLASAAARKPARGRVRPRVARRPTSRRLFTSEHGGNFETDSRYAAAIGVGTAWEVADSCFSSIVRDSEGVVRVTDLLRGLSVTLRAHQSYRVVRPERAGYLPATLPGVYFGVTGPPVAGFSAQVGRRQAVYGAFTHWGGNLRVDFAQAAAAHSRLLLHISTTTGYGKPELITPGQIARGAGDDYLVTLNSELAQWGNPVYIALLPEMNQANNAYSAFNADGSSRGSDHSPGAYQQAWRRSVVIIRGGSVPAINQQLARLNLPPLQATPKPVAPRTPPRVPPRRPYQIRQASPQSAVASLPTPQVAFVWAPQVAGSPDVRRNSPGAYYPGSAFVDIVGTDFYSQFPNFGGLARLYGQYPTKPFGFNEWGMWQNGDPGFATRFFAFIRTHQRIQLVVYNQGLTANGPFRLKRFPAATSEIRRQLAISAAVDYTPEWAPSP